MNRIGDVLETVNGIDLKNADHSTAVHAVKESKGLLDIVSIMDDNNSLRMIIICYVVGVAKKKESSCFTGWYSGRHCVTG